MAKTKNWGTSVAAGESLTGGAGQTARILVKKDTSNQSALQQAMAALNGSAPDNQEPTESPGTSNKK